VPFAGFGRVFLFFRQPLIVRVAISNVHLIGIFIKQLKVSSGGGEKRPKRIPGGPGRSNSKDSVAIVDLAG